MSLVEKENVVMGYSSNGLSAFAVLLDTNDTVILQHMIEDEIEARVAADDAEEAARTAADNAEAAARLALKFFKSIGTGTSVIGDIVATVQNDRLRLESRDGIQITFDPVGKKITFDGELLEQDINTEKINRANADSAEAAARTLADATEVTNRNNAISSALSALTYFKSIGGIVAQQPNDGMNIVGNGGIAISTSGGTLIISASSIMNFKTIKGINATQQNDSVDIVGTNGITVSASGKVITVNGLTLSNGIKKLQAWNDEDVNHMRISSWEEQIAGSSIAGYYLGTEMAKSVASERLTYWSGMLTLLGASKKGWVAFDDERMCYVEAGLSVTGWPDMGGNKIGVVYLPDTGYIYTVAETYTNGAISAAHKMSKVGYLPYVFMDSVMQTSVKLAELEYLLTDSDMTEIIG